MKKGVYLLIAFVLISLFCFSRRVVGQTDNPDYSYYNIAKQYSKEKNFILCYKNLIAFKYTNLKRLQLPINSDALIRLESQISDIENYLNQKGDCLQLVNAKGFSAADSILKERGKNIIVKPIDIK